MVSMTSDQTQTLQTLQKHIILHYVNDLTENHSTKIN